MSKKWGKGEILFLATKQLIGGLDTPKKIENTAKIMKRELSDLNKIIEASINKHECMICGLQVTKTITHLMCPYRGQKMPAFCYQKVKEMEPEELVGAGFCNICEEYVPVTQEYATTLIEKFWTLTLPQVCLEHATDLKLLKEAEKVHLGSVGRAFPELEALKQELMKGTE